MSQVEILDPPLVVPAAEHEAGLASLSDFAKGDRGVIVRVGQHRQAGAVLQDGELERRLLELGFVEGARVELLHEGPIGRDPIAVRLDDMRVALRRREAASIFVSRTGPRA